MKPIFLLIFSITSYFLSGQGEIKVIGAGNGDNVIVSSSDSQTEAILTLDRSGYLPDMNAASKLTSQSTFGANYEEIESIASMGVEDWVDSQMAMPLGPSLVEAILDYRNQKRIGENNPDAGINNYFWEMSWWQYHMSQEDLLRQRIAFALSEILVISKNSGFGNRALVFGSYYDMLLKHAFGNYKDLLMEVTYHGAMGDYLTYVNNPKTDTEENRFPDENYAREVMQLFTIGLFELNPDGSRKLDGGGNPIPTYDNEDISEFSKIFTGLMWGDRELEIKQFFKNPQNDSSYLIPMQMLEDMHEPGAKTLLNGQVVPNRNPIDGNADIADAIDNLFNHPNIGPFIGKLLIQRLVTSNPSPEYIERVGAAFANNGSGVRGDMKAIIKAILLDDEARACAAVDDPYFGMLREPFIRYVQLSNAFDLTTTSGKYRNAMGDVQNYINQIPFGSPSVFNFFQPDNQPIGPVADADLVAPEFQIVNSQTLIGYLNGLNQWIVRDDPVDEYRIYSGEDIPDNERSFFELSDEIALATDDRLHELLDRLNLILAQGRLSKATTEIIIEAMKEFPQEDEDDLNQRVRIAIYLVMTAPEFLINR